MAVDTWRGILVANYNDMPNSGGHHFMETKIGDYVIAYALPEK